MNIYIIIEVIKIPDFDLGKVVGSDGEDAPSITSIEKTSTSGLIDTYTITLSDDSEYTFEVTNGADGSDGSTVAINQVLSTGTKIATITINGTPTDLYCSSSGGGGSADIVTSWEQVLSDSKVPSEKLTKTTIDGKADSVHTHTKSQITDLSIPEGSSTATDIKMNGTQSAGSSTKYAKADHVHPTDTSRVGSVVVTQTLTSGTKLGSISVDGTSTDLYCSSGGGGSVDIVTSWESTLSDSKVPSEKLVKNTIDTKINTSDIVDNLTTNDATKPLSAKQGKALNDLIGSAIAYINL